MPSRLESLAATDFDRGMSEVKETVIRRIGGKADRTEPVEAVTEFDVEGGGFTTNANGQKVEFGGKLEIAATQETTDHDHWVIQDGPMAGVYHQLGLPTSGDGGSKTIYLTKRKGRVAAQPRTRGQ